MRPSPVSSSQNTYCQRAVNLPWLRLNRPHYVLTQPLIRRIATNTLMPKHEHLKALHFQGWLDNFLEFRCPVPAAKEPWP